MGVLTEPEPRDHQTGIGLPRNLSTAAIRESVVMRGDRWKSRCGDGRTDDAGELRPARQSAAAGP